MRVNTKKRWIDKIFGILKDSPKGKTDLLQVLKNAVLDGLLDNESLKMIEGVFKVSEVQVRDCLLYTSPSPRDGLLSRMPSSA